MLLARTSFRDLAWRHPEWWSVALSAAAWLVLLSSPWLHLFHGTIGARLLIWSLMIVAMMFPLVIAQVRDTAFRSLWRRRHRAIACFLSGYLLSWVLFGAAVLAIRARWNMSPGAAAVAAILIVIAWHLAPWQRRALRRCHRVMPLAPMGWRADASCVRFGWGIGGSCIGACGALMTACVLMDHSLMAMAVVTALTMRERAANA